MYSFTGQGAISQKLNDVCNKTLHLALKHMNTVGLEYHLSLLATWMGQIFVQKLTAHERPLIQSNLFLLAVYMHEVPLYLCSIFCSRSQVRLSIASYHIWMRSTPRIVSHNLNICHSAKLIISRLRLIAF